jgi:tRNA A-37 threonylcarbamoyl transferase component Bud32
MLLGGRKSGIVTKFASKSIDRWQPESTVDVSEIHHKVRDALKRLHKSGFMHGDVTLRNFLMERTKCE